MKNITQEEYKKAKEICNIYELNKYKKEQKPYKDFEKKYGSLSLRRVIGLMVHHKTTTVSYLSKMINDSEENINLFIAGNDPNYDIEKKKLLANHLKLDLKMLVDFNELKYK